MVTASMGDIPLVEGFSREPVGLQGKLEYIFGYGMVW
jgi:hypothetical protein